jgi:hypothetical protein
MNNQDFVDLVEEAIDKLEKQNDFSKDGNGGCFYLNNKGHCCIVGHMMPNDIVRKEADSYRDTGLIELVEQEFEWTRQFTKEQIDLMYQLQRQHDAYHISVDTAVCDMRDSLSEWRDEHNV